MPPREPHFEIFRDSEGMCRWRTQAANGRFDGHGDQPFRDDHDAQRGILDHCHTVMAALGLEPLSDEALLERIRIERTEA